MDHQCICKASGIFQCNDMIDTKPVICSTSDEIKLRLYMMNILTGDEQPSPLLKLI
jgi:hypothetical protein